jgi:hypothetical protein
VRWLATQPAGSQRASSRGRKIQAPVASAPRLASNTPAAGLRAVDVDPTKIKRAVLTLDGWVCPVEAPQYGARR